MDRGVVCTDQVDQIDQQFRRLRAILRRIDENMPVEIRLTNFHLSIARSLAGELVVALRDFGDDDAVNAARN